LCGLDQNGLNDKGEESDWKYGAWTRPGYILDIISVLVYVPDLSTDFAGRTKLLCKDKLVYAKNNGEKRDQAWNECTSDATDGFTILEVDHSDLTESN